MAIAAGQSYQHYTETERWLMTGSGLIGMIAIYLLAVTDPLVGV